MKIIVLGLTLFCLTCVNVNIVFAQDDIIIDNGNSTTSFTGTWLVSGAENPYGIDSLYSRDGATYIWHADLLQTGVYEVYMWWTEYSSRSTNTPVIITHLGASQVVYVNQTQNRGMWNYLGTYSFDTTSRCNITVTAVDSVHTYCADAVKFVYVLPEAPKAAQGIIDYTPGIISYAPDVALVNDTEVAQRTFNITVNQTVTVRDM